MGKKVRLTTDPKLVIDPKNMYANAVPRSSLDDLTKKSNYRVEFKGDGSTCRITNMDKWRITADCSEAKTT